MFQAWYQRFCAQPHQGFFASGILLLLAFSLMLFSVYFGGLNLNASVTQIHAYAFVFVIFVQFFMGFLYVVFPKFLVQAEIARQIYMRHFWLYFLASWGLFGSFLLSISWLSSIFMVLNLFAQILSFKLLFSIFKRSKVADKYDTKWVLIGLGAGIMFHTLFLLDEFFTFGIQNFAVLGGFWLFLFVIFFAISQRMIPFFASVKVAGYKVKKSKFLMEKLFVLLGFKLIFSQFLPNFSFTFDIALCLFLVVELLAWRLPLRGQNAILWVLYLGLFWLPVGFLLGGIQGICELLGVNFSFEKTPLHAVALGYFFTILVGFGTRVTLGHSGQTINADSIATKIFIFTQVVVLARLLAGFGLNFGLDYMFWLLFSLGIFVLALGVWSVRYLPILIKGFDPHAKQPIKIQNSTWKISQNTNFNATNFKKN